MGTDFSTLGWIALVLGLAIRYFINRRKFNRRAVTGLEQFGSYEKAVGTNLLERLFKLVGLILILLGAFVILGEWLKKDTEAHEQKIENTRPIK